METPKRGSLLAKEEEDWDERVTDAGEWKKVERTSFRMDHFSCCYGTAKFLKFNNLVPCHANFSATNECFCVDSQCLPSHTLLQFPSSFEVNQCSHFLFWQTQSSKIYVEKILLDFLSFSKVASILFFDFILTSSGKIAFSSPGKICSGRDCQRCNENTQGENWSPD